MREHDLRAVIHTWYSRKLSFSSLAHSTYGAEPVVACSKSYPIDPRLSGSRCELAELLESIYAFVDGIEKMAYVW